MKKLACGHSMGKADAEHLVDMLGAVSVRELESGSWLFDGIAKPFDPAGAERFCGDRGIDLNDLPSAAEPKGRVGCILLDAGTAIALLDRSDLWGRLGLANLLGKARAGGLRVGFTDDHGIFTDGEADELIVGHGLEDLRSAAAISCGCLLIATKKPHRVPSHVVWVATLSEDASLDSARSSCFSNSGSHAAYWCAVALNGELLCEQEQAGD